MSVESIITENLDVWTSAIKTKSTSGRGSSNKFELYGIKKLRELILELAIRGKLVSQNSDDKAASEILKKVEERKLQLIKDKKVKKAKSLPPISSDEIPFQLPPSWQWCRFSELLDFSGGGQPPKSFFSETMLEGYVQLIQIRDLGPNPQPVYIPKEKASKFCSEDDVMVGRYGASVGKVFWGKEGSYNVALVKIHNDFKAYTPSFIYLLLSSPLGQSFFGGVSRSAQDGFNKNDIAPKLIPLLSFEEQNRIVAKVDELMSLCDQLESQTESNIEAHQTLVKSLLETLSNAKDADELNESWQRISEHFDVLFTTEDSIDQLKQTILQLAVMGKLVKQDPNDEPASKLLERIAVEKEQLIKDKKIKKQKPLPPVSESEKPFDIPSGWLWGRIGDVALTTDYGLSDKSHEGINGVPVLAMGQIQDGVVNLSTQKKVPHNVDSLPELYLEDRDLLYNRTNSPELVGKTGIYRAVDEAYTFASYLIRIRTLKTSLLPEFLNLNMQTQLFRTTQIEPFVKQQCGQANVNGTIMKNMLVAIPPEKEMERILGIVEVLMQFCHDLRIKITKKMSLSSKVADLISTTN